MRVSRVYISHADGGSLRDKPVGKCALARLSVMHQDSSFIQARAPLPPGHPPLPWQRLPLLQPSRAHRSRRGAPASLSRAQRVSVCRASAIRAFTSLCSSDAWSKSGQIMGLFSAALAERSPRGASASLCRNGILGAFEPISGPGTAGVCLACVRHTGDCAPPNSINAF